MSNQIQNPDNKKRYDLEDRTAKFKPVGAKLLSGELSSLENGARIDFTLSSTIMKV